MKEIKIPFNMEEYKKGGYKVVTRDGREVSIFCNSVKPFYIEGAISGIKKILHYSENGKYLLGQDSEYDLFITKNEFEDGDFVSFKHLHSKTVIIFKKIDTSKDNSCHYYVSYSTHDDGDTYYDVDKELNVYHYVLKNAQLASKDEKDRLLLEIKEHGQYWNSENKHMEFLFMVEPFGEVLVRNTKDEKWLIEHFGFYDKENKAFSCTGGKIFKHCIPFNNETDDLLGKYDECPDKFKNMIIL